MSETEVDYMSLVDAEMSRLKGEIRVLTRERDNVKQQTLLFVAGDLRRAAEAHLKSAGIESRRLYRNYLYDLAQVLIERATFYEDQAVAQVGGYVSRDEAERIVLDMMTLPAKDT